MIWSFQCFYFYKKEENNQLTFNFCQTVRFYTLLKKNMTKIFENPSNASLKLSHISFFPLLCKSWRKFYVSGVCTWLAAALEATSPWKKNAGELNKRLTPQPRLMARIVFCLVLMVLELTGNTTAKYLKWKYCEIVKMIIFIRSQTFFISQLREQNLQ